MKTRKLLQKLTFFALILSSITTWSQVGIGTTSPDAVLDIVSSNSGILLPRIALSSSVDASSVLNPKGDPLTISTLVWNTGLGGLTPAGYYYWQNNQWNLISSSNQKQVHFGKILVSAAGVVNVTGLGFTPTSIEFIAINRAQGYNTGTYRSGDNNSNDIRMAGGFTTGYATNYGGVIDQQVIASGYSGSSLNNIGTYSSSNHCIAAFFVNNNGEPIHDNGTATNGPDTQSGLVRATLQTFNTDGFSLNFDRFLAPAAGTPDRTNSIVIIYKAYR